MSKPLEALKRAATRTFDHYKGKIQRVNEIRREKDQKMQEALDIQMRPKEKNSDYITVPPPKRQEVMSVGRKIIK